MTFAPNEMASEHHAPARSCRLCNLAHLGPDEMAITRHAPAIVQRVS